MMIIKLSNGDSALVDDEFAYLAKYSWYKSVNGYAVRRFRIKPNKMGIERMHRIINQTPVNMLTDHINKNRLDNRKVNLRSVTPAANQLNRSVNKNSQYGYPGISLEPNGKYRARVQYKGKKINLGNFENLEKALKVSQLKRKEIGFYA